MAATQPGDPVVIEWSEAIPKISLMILAQLLKEQQAVSYNQGFGQDDIDRIIRDCLSNSIPGHAYRREKSFQDAVLDAQYKLEKAVKNYEASDREVARYRQDLTDTENRYKAQLKQEKQNHQQKLMEIDVEISGKNQKIEDLQKKLDAKPFDRQRQRKNVPTEKAMEYYTELEDNYNKLEKQIKDLETQLKKAQKDIAHHEQVKRHDDQDINKYLKQIDDRKNELRSAKMEISGLHAKVETLQDQKTADDTLIVELTKQTDQLRKELDKVKALLETAKNRASSVGTVSTEISSQIGPNLQDELANAAHVENLEEQVDTLTERVRELEEESGKTGGDSAKYKKERDEVQKQLKKAAAKLDENAKEIRRLMPFERSTEKLQKIERELHSQLKAKAGDLKRVEEELKQLKKKADKADELSAAGNKCEKEKAALQTTIDDLTSKLDQARKDRDDGGKQPLDDKIKQLRKELDKAQDDLREAREAREKLEARIRELEARRPTGGDDAEDHEAKIKALRDDYEARLARAEKTRGDLAEYFIVLLDDIVQHATQVRGDMQNATDINQAMIDQYSSRLEKEKENIRKNPNTTEAALNRRRVLGLEKEIERMREVIKVLKQESQWLHDTIQRFKDGEQRSQAVAVEAALSAATAGIDANTQTDTQTDTGVGPLPNPFAHRERGFNSFFMLINILSVLFMLATSIAQGREYGAYKAANSAVRRGLFISKLEKGAICLRVPAWELLWEFIILLAGGTWAWKA
ncbi:hypothetical protein GGR54DRAFT_103373 [Hypoxylon sp. NC1633]|nr:hypothetical protein GGR54DRAFT_103373 [Hypoxylon sp. NC1633]